jgi:hypothetical protein
MDIDRNGRSITEKILQDKLEAARAECAELTQRLQLAYSALHSEQHYHDEVKARLARLRRNISKQGLSVKEDDE